MRSDRRNFIRNSCLLALTAPLVINRFLPPEQEKIPALGIQLYMMREDMARDPVGTLSRLGRMGYTQIESYDGDKGMYWGMKIPEFNRLANDHGLHMVSSHYAGDKEGFEKTASAAASGDLKYLIYPWKGPQKSIEDFKRIADEFNAYGAICKKNGLRFAYHPHDYPYKKVDGQLPIDVLLERTDKDLVDFQMDFYYTVTEGLDPIDYIKKYAPRFRLCHMRDVLKNRLPAGSTTESACDLGQGIINYPVLLKTCIDHGMNYFFVEQSRLFQETAFQSASVNADYLRGIKFE